MQNGYLIFVSKAHKKMKTGFCFFVCFLFFFSQAGSALSNIQSYLPGEGFNFKTKKHDGVLGLKVNGNRFYNLNEWTPNTFSQFLIPVFPHECNTDRAFAPI